MHGGIELILAAVLSAGGEARPSAHAIAAVAPARAPATACAPAGRPILAEVFYDAIGDDTGLEFVEIFNPGAAPVPLAGLRIEAGDGAGPGRWSLRWTGQTPDTIAPRARFVIGGARVAPAPQRIASLELQNGPDAVRLVWPDGVSEVLGYGNHALAEYACGAAAVDAPSGQSLARVPDDADLGANALDFRPAAPSPGRRNRPERDVAWVVGSLALAPEQPEPDGAARLAGALTNRGATALAMGEVGVAVRSSGAFGTRDLAAVTIGRALAAGDTARLEVDLAGLPAGRQRLECRLALGGDEAPENDLDSLSARVGPGPLAITEIQFHPAQGEGEWIEVRNRGDEPLDLAVFTFSDRGTTAGRPAEGEGACDPDSLALLAQDRAALLGRHPRLDPRRVWQVGPWPSLNNSDDSSGVADQAVLREADGTLCVRVAYSAAGVPAGVPIERGEDGEWRAASDPDGTPLLPPRVPAPLAGRFEVAPRRIRSGAAEVRLAWELPWPRGRAAIEVYDLAGAAVAQIMSERAVTRRGAREWRPEGLPPGVYLVVLRAHAESGGETLGDSRLLRIDGSAP